MLKQLDLTGCNGRDRTALIAGPKLSVKGPCFGVVVDREVHESSAAVQIRVGVRSAQRLRNVSKDHFLYAAWWLESLLITDVERLARREAEADGARQVDLAIEARDETPITHRLVRVLHDDLDLVLRDVEKRVPPDSLVADDHGGAVA